VDELQLHRDIERLLKKDIPQVVIDGFAPDPSIKAEPIQQRRGQSPGRKNPSRKPATAGNGQRAPFKGRSSNQSRSSGRSRYSSQSAG
jgi:ATP-dependent RNA helicase RhlE